jgi:nucleoside 2-deoxyribosyltransferase
MKSSIYLAGPITGLSYEKARAGWRQQFAEHMAGYPDIELFSPMRAKEFLQDVVGLPGTGKALESLQFALAKPAGILTRDFNDVVSRDLMVACFLDQPDRVSIGTVWEIGVAYSHRKPIIVVMRPGNIHDHVFITHTAGYVVETLEEAAHVAGSILTPAL